MLQLKSLMEQQTWASSSGAVTGSPDLRISGLDATGLQSIKSLIVGHITDQIELPLNRLTTSHIVKYS
jgi:hypothetical protein